MKEADGFFFVYIQSNGKEAFYDIARESGRFMSLEGHFTCRCYELVMTEKMCVKIAHTASFFFFFKTMGPGCRRSFNQPKFEIKPTHCRIAVRILTHRPLTWR